MTDLQSKAVDIQGKQYVLVKDRVLAFNTDYPNGGIETDLVSQPESDRIVIKATVTPNCAEPQRVFTGYSQAVVGEGYINKTAALENCETSAVGRALAMMGIGVFDSIASVDEMGKAIAQQRTPVKTTAPVSGLSMPCSIHHVPMTERMSKKTNKPYFAHNLPDGTFCFGDKPKYENPAQKVEAPVAKTQNDADFESMIDSLS